MEGRHAADAGGGCDEPGELGGRGLEHDQVLADVLGLTERELARRVAGLGHLEPVAQIVSDDDVEAF